MSLVISNDDYLVVQQTSIKKYIRLDVLNFDYNVLDEISGYLMSLSVSVDAESDMRRSCNVSFVVTDSTLSLQPGGAIWLNRYIRPYVGYENIHTQEIQWYNQGIYIINAPSWQYDAITNTLSFEGLDLMSKMTGTRNGQLPGVPTLIPQGSNVRNAMISAIALTGFNRYVVSECLTSSGDIQNVPYDIEISAGGYVYDIIKALRDIMPNYQVYFDVDGVFHYEPIPSGEDEPVALDDDLLQRVEISENINVDFTSVKNYVEVYGRTHDVQYYGTVTEVREHPSVDNGYIIDATFATTDSSFGEGGFIGLVLPQNISNASQIQIFSYDGEGNGLATLDIWTENGQIQTGGGGAVVEFPYCTELPGNQYIVFYRESHSTVRYYGTLQATAKYFDANPESPFYIGTIGEDGEPIGDGPIGVIRYVCMGGDYDNIVSNQLALERAKLEIYWRCRLNDTITLNTIPLPWLDVNILMVHSPSNSDEEYQYMIKSFTVDYGESNSMSIIAARYYPYYPNP